jgi:hypothetical protein
MLVFVTVRYCTDTSGAFNTLRQLGKKTLHLPVYCERLNIEPLSKPLPVDGYGVHTSILELLHRFLIPPTPLEKQGKNLLKSPFSRGI